MTLKGGIKFLYNIDTKASLTQKYNLKAHTLQIRKDCVGKEIPFPGRRGRPPVSDSEALGSLR